MQEVFDVFGIKHVIDGYAFSVLAGRALRERKGYFGSGAEHIHRQKDI